MRSMLALSPLAGVVLAVVPGIVVAQQRAARPITARPVEFAEPFSALTRMLELRDGRILLHDARERKLGVVDFAAGEFREVARQGAGPLEYRTVLSMIRLPGDSVMLLDLGNQRALLMTPDGRPVRTSAMGEVGGDVSSMIGRPLARDADARGRLYGTHRGLVVGGGQMSQSDSVAIVRIAGASIDTLALYGASSSPSSRMVDGVVTMRARGFPALDGWAVFPDGRVLLVHSERFVPELILPDGSRRMAAAVPFTPVSVTAADRAAHMDEAREQYRGLRMPAPPGGTSPRFEVAEPEKWQTHMPPLASTTILVDSRGRAWVHVRERSGSAGERHDLLDADGKLVDAVRMPKGVRLAGMGKGVLYGAREDEDGLIYLQRYPLP